MKRIFVTGASGFIGSNLTKRLFLEGYRVVALLRKNSYHPFLEDIPIKKVFGDVTDRESKLAGFSNPQELINELKKIYPIKNLDEKYYFIYVIPFLDLRLHPIKIEEFEVKINDQDLQGKIIEVDLDIVKKVLLKKLKQFMKSD